MKLKNSKLSRAFKSMLTIISPELNTRILYLIKYKKPIRLKNPIIHAEKLQWLKLNVYTNNPLVTQCADKYAVRDYIINCGFPEILNELLGVYFNPEEIDWQKLPQKFALKSNYGCGFNIICSDKDQLDIPETMLKLKHWGKTKQHLLYSEMQYAPINRRIICEKFIEGKTKGSLPEDYKIYCFNGIPKYVMVCMGRESGKPKYYFFDEKLNLARINKDSKNAPNEIFIDNPEVVKRMFCYAEKLSKPFPFVRVDFYLSSNKPIFGELTFTPAGGMDTNRLHETDILFGKMLQLPMK